MFCRHTSDGYGNLRKNNVSRGHLSVRVLISGMIAGDD